MPRGRPSRVPEDTEQALKRFRSADPQNQSNSGLPVASLFASPPSTSVISSSSLVSTSPGSPQCSLFSPPTAIRQMSIGELTQGVFSNHVLTGRITQVSETRTWANGSAMSFDIADVTGEISVTLFNELIAKFETMTKVNAVVELRSFRVKPTNPAFQHNPEQPNEVLLSQNGMIDSSSMSVPPIEFNFVDIAHILGTAPASILDFMGIIYEDEGLVEGTSAGGKPYSFRNLLATDKTKSVLKLKLWGKKAVEMKVVDPVAVAIRRGVVQSYAEEIYLNIGSRSLFWVQPEMEEAQALMLWLAAERR